PRLHADEIEVRAPSFVRGDDQRLSVRAPDRSASQLHRAARARAPLPSAFITMRWVSPRSSTAKAIRSPPGAIDGPPISRAFAELQSCVDRPPASFQIRSVEPSEET